jgi:hypothetical protein
MSEAHGETGPSEEDDDIKSKSETAQAIKLFSEFKSPVDVIIALDLPANQVQAIYEEYLELDGMHRFARIYEEAKYDLDDLLRLHRIAKLLGLEKQDIISALELIKHNQLETLQWKAGCLRSEITRLEWEKRKSRYHLFDSERMINESEETLEQKRGEMAYLNRECRKLGQRFIEYNAKLSPIESGPDTDSNSTQIVPYNKNQS